MTVSAEVRRGGEGDQRVVLLSRRSGSPLGYAADVGAGVHLGADLMAPNDWVSVSVDSPDPVSAPLLEVLVGERSARDVLGLHEPGPDGGQADTGQLVVEPTDAGPWQRVAVVDALDRWLQLPLDQSLVDAERGITRARAAMTLPAHGAVRALVIAAALRLVRRAAAGLVDYLRELGRRGRPAPSRLVGGLAWLVEGYAELAAEVAGPDRQLASVIRAWRVARDRLTSGEVTAPSPRAVADTARGQEPPPAYLIDPRQVPARVLALSSDPASAEVSVSAAEPAAVRVRVPAYRRALDRWVEQRLLVRLIDRLTAEPRSQGLLTMSPAPGQGRASPGRRYFEGSLPLLGAALDDLRADVFDPLSDVPPAAEDTDDGLRAVRRATVFLGEWRRLVALAQVRSNAAAPARELDALAARLRPADGEDRPGLPAFPGGPTPGELRRLAAGDEAELRGWLRGAGAEPPPAGPTDGVLGMTVGAGRLLVAELASADAEPEDPERA